MEHTSIQLSIEFKETLKAEKAPGESYEDYMKRLREKALTSEPQEVSDPQEAPVEIKDKAGKVWAFPNKAE